jgi:hypothetical protein
MIVSSGQDENTTVCDVLQQAELLLFMSFSEI